MFTLIATRHGRGLRLQRRRPRSAPAIFPPASAAMHGSVPLYFEAAAVITTLVLLGQVLELRAAQPTPARDPGAAGSGATARPASCAAMAASRMCRSHEVHGRRSAARAARREESRSTASVDRRRSAVDESMITGEPMPVEKAAGRPRHRRHGQHDRQRSSCAPSASAATRCWRRSCAWSARRSGAARRSSAWPTGGGATSCRRSSLRRRRHVHRLGLFRARAALGARAGQRRRRADHRLSLRAGAGHADVDHGRHRPRRDRRRADQERRGAGDAGEGRHAGRRQDRHADRRQAAPVGGRAPSTGSDERDVLRWPPALERASEHPLAARHRRRRRGARDRLPLVARRLRSRHRPGRQRHASDGRRVAVGNARAAGRRRASRGLALGAADALRARGQTVVFVAIDGALAGLLGVADPVKDSTARGDRRRCTARASRS